MGCGASDENNKTTNNLSPISQDSANQFQQDRISEELPHSPVNRDIKNQSVSHSNPYNPLNPTIPGNFNLFNPQQNSNTKDIEDEEAVLEQPGRQLKRKNSAELKEKEFERSKLKESDYEPTRPNLFSSSVLQHKTLEIIEKPPLPRVTLKPLNINATRLENFSSFAQPNLKPDSNRMKLNKPSPKSNSNSGFLPPIRREPIKFEPIPQGFDLDLEMENDKVFNNTKLDTEELVDELLRDMEEI